MKETFDVDVDLTLPVRRPPCLLARGHHGLPLVLVQGLRQQLHDLPELLRGVILLELLQLPRLLDLGLVAGEEAAGDNLVAGDGVVV